MTLGTSLDRLWERLHELRDVVLELSSILNDRPPTIAPKLVDDLVEVVEDVQARIEHAISPVGAALTSPDGAGDLDRVRRELGGCQDEYVEAIRGFVFEIDGRERRHWLRSLASERPGEWSAWVSAVDESIDRCRRPLFEASRALGLGWEELAWQAGSPLVSVHTTGIGQLAMPAPEEAPTITFSEGRGR
jgi:hypothetical protein